MKKICRMSSILLLPVWLAAFTGEIVKTFDLPSTCPTGLTYDGENLWLADRKADQLYCLDKKTGKVVRQLPSPGYWPMGLAWDGTALWVADLHDGRIYQVDPKSGLILKAVDTPGGSPRDLAWDGKYLWCADDGSDEIIQFSPDDGTTIKSFKAPSTEVRGLTFDGQYLWASDRGKDEIYLIDPHSGCVLLITTAPGPYTKGLTYDGQALWAVDYQNDKLYQLKVRDDEKLIRKNERKAKVIFTHQTRNFGPGKIRNLDVYIALPQNRDSQALNGALQFTPKYAKIVTDRWDQPAAYFNAKNIDAGKVVNFEMSADVTAYEVQYFIYPEKVGKLESIPADIKNKYLENNEKYQFDHPVIQKALREALGDENNPYWIARKIYNYLIEKLYYERVGGWNTAPTVLARGNGSCSEYTFVYIAMCRAAGLPARYVGSVVVRGDDASLDDVFHRWVEVYLPNYGWIPVDPSGGDNESPRDQANYFGHLANRFLITTESGGDSELLGWYYNSNEFYTTDPQTKVYIETIGEWEPR
ncbi:MAG: transglutaminase domain-containing protein [Candidatus Marinimicrobia bacterium]|nr:transglutaminase domain-containing protein [Candidatus Neomarinimicrobiota bacterium]